MDAHVDLAVDLVGDGEQLDGIAHVRRMLEIDGLDRAYALGEDIIERHAGVEGDGSEDCDLGGRVVPIDVGPWGRPRHIRAPGHV